MRPQAETSHPQTGFLAAPMWLHLFSGKTPAQSGRSGSQVHRESWTSLEMTSVEASCLASLTLAPSPAWPRQGIQGPACWQAAMWANLSGPLVIQEPGSHREVPSPVFRGAGHVLGTQGRTA